MGAAGRLGGVLPRGEDAAVRGRPDLEVEERPVVAAAADVRRRILAQARYQRIMELPLDFIPNDRFARYGEAEAQRVLGPAPESEKTLKKVRPPSGLPPYLASLYDVPLLTKEQEVHLFRKMNYLKHKAARLRDRLDPETHGAAPLLGVDGLALIGHGTSLDGDEAFWTRMRDAYSDAEIVELSRRDPGACRAPHDTQRLRHQQRAQRQLECERHLSRRRAAPMPTERPLEGERTT